jgi:hypothetical protein
MSAAIPVVSLSLTCIALVQLSMILLAAPAAIAGVFCSEMARGHICLMLGDGIRHPLHDSDDFRGTPGPGGMGSLVPGR